MKHLSIVNQLSDLKHRVFPRPFERLAFESFKDNDGNKNKLIGCEIGVYKAFHALSLLENMEIEKLYLINNGLADAVTVKNTSGTGIAVPAGKTMFVYNNGTNVVETVNSAVSLAVTGNATVGGTLAVTGTSAFTGATTFAADSTYNGTGQVKLPAGTTAQRSASPANGMIRYNSDDDGFEGYQDGAWGGISGAQANGVIYENNLTVTANYTLSTNKNGFSVGPITISGGVTVTIPSGQRWVVL